VDNLRGIPAASIGEISFMNPRDATTRFGTGHAGGAIMVKSQ